MCYILWVFSTSKKPIGILNLKPWTEFDFTPLNRYLRPQLSFISEETLIVSSVTLPSPLEMLSNPVNLPCGTKCWREFNIFWSGYFAFVLFIIIVIIIIIILLKLISAVVKDWFFSLGTIYFCVFQEVVFNWNFRVNLHVEIEVKNKKKEINKNKDKNWIGNLRAAPILSVKARLSAKLLVWKIFHIRLMQIKHIFALTLVLKVRVFVTVGKDSSAKHPWSSLASMACLLLISSPGSCRFPIWPPFRKTRKPWGRCC